MQDRSRTRVFQIFFDAYSRSKLDPSFIPYDNSAATRPQEREIYVFKNGYPLHRPDQDTLIGFVSWKFFEKSRVTGDEALRFMGDHPDVDVVLIDPFPALSAGYRNPWHQAQDYHPYLRDLARKIFEGAAIDPSFLDDVFDSRRVCYCNSFVAKPVFWDAYLPWIGRLETAIDGLPPSDRERFDQRADQAIDANHYSFFFERCLATFLHLNPQLHCAAFPAATVLSRQVDPKRLPNFIDALEKRASIDLNPSQEERRRLYSLLHPPTASKSALASAYFSLKYRVKNFVKHHVL